MSKKNKLKDGINALEVNKELILNRHQIVNHSQYCIKVLPDRTDKKFILNPFQVFSPANIQKYLDKLAIDKSPGPDEINSIILKKCSKSFSVPLSSIFISSFVDGELPELWKEANITPIHKSGSKLEASNYRPVSLTSI
ncbi:unnamed protein product [Brachionus calyciflorus]|uniref:RNA-directed DNA polymerase from mobile element jockey-like n=1 Tax=Brachionus calyciflorus TaxID=104777 RepID=A0A813RN85_9BILA|nr:unnamed protein product [Brachionus calyciflorus]